MNAGLGRQQAVGIIALDPKCRRFDPGFAARLLVEYLDLKALSSRPNEDTSCSSICAKSCASVPPAPA